MKADWGLLSSKMEGGDATYKWFILLICHIPSFLKSYNSFMLSFHKKQRYSQQEEAFFSRLVTEKKQLFSLVIHRPQIWLFI